MPKFVLVDNSIIDTRGHHYQYAMHCLNGAEKLGYESLLAVNKNNNLPRLSWKVLGIYTNNFWVYDKYEPYIMNLYHRLEKFNNKILNFVILNCFGSFLIRKLLDKNKIAEFSKDTEELVKQIKLSDGDIVFLPTSGLVEMFGILECSKKNIICKNASWHFLFRRSLHTETTEYDFSYLKLRLLRKAFQVFSKNSDLCANFYTDSIQLTQQYEKLGINFETLPVPHTIFKSEPRKTKNTINVTYLGDAREEKGYHHLPRIIQDLWCEYVKPGMISFTIQSYFDSNHVDPKTIVALSQLRNFDVDKITLIHSTLNQEEYQNLLLSSDVVLLLYDRTNYTARTSGILVEALGCGIPVVVPSGTWLSRQFIKEIYQYQISLKEKFLKKSFDNIELHFEGNIQKDLKHGKLVLDSNEPTMQIMLKIEGHISHILVTLFFGKKPSNLTSILVDAVHMTSDDLVISSNSNLVEQTDLDYATILLPIKNHVGKIFLKFKKVDSNVVITKLSIDALNISQKDIPLGAVGITYDDPDEISEKLANIIDNYTHYLKTAKELSAAYLEKHNAKLLVQKLSKNIKTDISQINR